MRRWLGVLVALVFVSLSLASPATAATLQRTWTAPLGASASNGRVALQAFSDGTGKLNLAIKSVRANATYRVEIRSGSCSSLGSVVTTLFPATADATGAIDTYRNLTVAKMGAVWTVARKGSIAFRLVHSAGTLCGNLRHPVATRIRIPSLVIDLPIIAGPPGYPYCKVAMYHRALWQPREPGVTFLFAHARTGMFLRLLSYSKINNGAGLIGRTVYVYTSDSKIHTYRIDRVRRHVRSITNVFGITSERLWMQTSEGPNYTYPKLIVEAKRVATASTSYAASHPKARPVRC